MKIAVLMSAYNGEEYIEQQIDSILNQEGELDIDLIVRDDGSIDSTIEILRKYESENKLKWYSGCNIGSAASFFDLLHNSEEYDYYAYADQDDIWFVDKLVSAINKLSKYNVPALYFANAELVDNSLNKLDKVVYRNIPNVEFYTVLCVGNILGCTIVFNYKLFEIIKNKEIPKRMVMHDHYTALVCLAVGGKIVYDEIPRLMYRQHNNNVVGVSTNKIQTIKNRIMYIFKKPDVSISEQACELLSQYENEMDENIRMWTKKVIEYKKSIITKIRLAISKKTKYITINMSFAIRLSIVLGNL